ncbi:MAG: DUF853 family protein [Bacteroidales bacterium]|nr:DUF853 family protein [Bacteroidales bacterium]MBN2820738.1 DUF853 family protein [Bacteroidales bacterium]
MISPAGLPLIGKNHEGKELFIVPEMANRHGLIAGATGTGKTVTLQVLAETFSDLGVPVFVTDVKGDLSGIASQAKSHPKISERIEKMQLNNYISKPVPVCFWDIFGEKGHPVRTTISEMGPVLLARLLNLNDVQAGVLNLVFKIADDNNLLLLDLKDLRKMLEFVAGKKAEYTASYGTISTASIGAIQRGLLLLEEQGADMFFGEPAFEIFDFIQTDQGKGIVNILAADKLMLSPGLYSTFLLWLLSELFEELPESGDRNKPKLVFFFDEAHLLFDDAPKALMDKIEQVVRLIRSKGVGIYFISQNPLDIPDEVLGQLGNRIQHALRAFTPRDQKAVNAAAETFRTNPRLNVEEIITQLGVGEALISFLDEKGIPNPVERALIVPPQSQIGPVDDSTRQEKIKQSLVYGAYETKVDRESAYEVLNKKFALETAQLEEEKIREQEKSQSKKTTDNELFDDLKKYATRNMSRQIGNELGRQLVRGLLGSFLGTSSSGSRKRRRY